MPRIALFALITACMSFSFMSAQTPRKIKRNPTSCQYWQSKVDEEIQPLEMFQEVDEQDPQTILEGIHCLLNMEGNKHPARFSGATHMAVSQLFPDATADVAALYYISYLYYQRWDHANAIALRGENGTLNSPESILIAYESYREWFEKVKRIGLIRAREMKLDPLKDAKVKWY